MAKTRKQTAAKKAPARERRSAARSSAPEEVLTTEAVVKPGTPADAPHRAAQRDTAGGGGRRLGGKLVA
jgi:hypothetical protein